jgi:hypothetical protein
MTYAGGRCEIGQPFDLRGVQAPSVAVFSSTRLRLAPGIGTMSSSCASHQANAIWTGVAPATAATARRRPAQRPVTDATDTGCPLSAERCAASRIAMTSAWNAALTNSSTSPRLTACAK